MEAVRDAFGKALVEIGRHDKRIVVLDADLASSTKVTYFAAEFPDRYFQVGIAEQNMTGIAAGLALMGRIPFTSTFGVFASRRACDQVAMSIAHPRLPVKLVGAYSGILSGNNGATHQAVEDVAIMRAIPNMVVVDPADAVEMSQVVKAIVEYDGPVYLRMSRDAWPDVVPPDYTFKLGKSVLLRPGDTVALVCSGMMASLCLEAASRLERQGISAMVLHMPTIKPLDIDSLVEAAEQTGCVVTAENHNVIGGLGSAVAEVLSEFCPVPVKKVGLQDTYGECGSNEELLEKYGLSAAHIVKAALEVLERKKK
ncbi:MAG TPA: transketolase family protein [Firmicutes bacterium]|nr:transketolase family protein [Bacillota bacterium]